MQLEILFAFDHCTSAKHFWSALVYEFAALIYAFFASLYSELSAYLSPKTL